MSVLYVGAPIVSVLLIFSLRMLELSTRRAVVPGPVREQASFRLFLGVGVLMLLGALAEFFWREERLRWPTFFAGWLLALMSFALRRWAIRSLGKYWSLHVEIRPTHELIKSGPFRWMRHPTYLSMAMELLAGSLILNAIYTAVSLFPVFLVILVYRLRLEEQALVDKFGDSYLDYQREVPALLPYKWPTIHKA